MVITRTPFRVSFFGGGTDYPGWFQRHGGAVLACGIDKYCYITLRYLPPFFPHRYRIVYSRTESCGSPSEIQHPAVRAVCEQFFANRGVEIHHDGDLPARSGMGSSSSFAVGLLNAAYALTGTMTSRMQLAREAIRLEQDVLKETVGCQDQVLASYGGLHFVRFDPSGEILVRPITISRERLREFSGHLMLFFTGVIRTSSDVAGSYVPDIASKEAQLASYVPMVEEGSRILSSAGSLRPFGELLHKAWMAKRSLSPEVSSPEIDGWYETARKNGAVGGKLLGAGGGGFLLLFVEPSRQAAVREALGGLLEIPFELDPLGSQIIFFDRQNDYRQAETRRSGRPVAAPIDRNVSLAAKASTPTKNCP